MVRALAENRDFRIIHSGWILNSDPLQTTLTQEYRFYNAMRDIAERVHIKV